MNKDYEMCAVLIESEKREELRAAKTAEEVLDIAFCAAHNHWMYLDEQTQFTGAIGAALIALKEGPEFERVQRSVTALGKLSAMMNALQQGIPVDLEAMFKEKEAEPDQTPVIPLSKLWNDIRYTSDRKGEHE